MRKEGITKSAKKPEGRNTVMVSVRVTPWIAFALRKYAEVYGGPVNFHFSMAVNGMISGINRKIMEKWIEEYRKTRGDQDGD